MNPYRIILADDHVMLRQGIKKIIEESEDMTVVSEANDGLELLRLLKKVPADMVILDISMPNLRGIEATREIKISYPDIKVMILSMHQKKEYLYHALSAGAEGFCLKEDTDTELFTGIDTIRKGGVYLSPILSRQMTDDFIEICKGEGKLPEEPLTTREREVLKLLAEGKANKEIAELLYISIRTVQHHRANLMEKLKIKNLAELVKYAIRMGYTSDIT